MSIPPRCSVLPLPRISLFSNRASLRAVLVADASAITVDHHAVMYPEAPFGHPGRDRRILQPNIAPEAIPLLFVHVHSTCFKLGYPLDGRSVEAERRGSFAVGEELGVEDRPFMLLMPREALS